MTVSRFQLAICFLFICSLAFLTITPFCGWIFQCGCTVFEGVRHCNIFSTETPDCPWCSHGAAGSYLPLGLILSASTMTAQAALRWSGQSLGWGLAGALFGYLLWGSVAGFLSALYHGYPTFYGWAF